MIDFIYSDYILFLPVRKQALPESEGAHQFVNFLLNPQVVALNSEVVIYATALEEAYEIILANVDSEDPWRQNWVQANLTYYNNNKKRLEMNQVAFYEYWLV